MMFNMLAKYSSNARRSLRLHLYFYSVCFFPVNLWLIPSFLPPHPPLPLPFLCFPHPSTLFLFFLCVFLLAPQLPPPLLPLVVLRLVFESSHRVTDAPQIQVVKLLVEHEGPLDELRRFLPISETLGTVTADVVHGVWCEDGAVGTKDHHCGKLFHLKHGLQFPET